MMNRPPASYFDRPITLADLEGATAIDRRRLDRVLRRNRIVPSFRVGNTRCYGTAEVRRLFEALKGTRAA